MRMYYFIITQQNSVRVLTASNKANLLPPAIKKPPGRRGPPGGSIQIRAFIRNS